METSVWARLQRLNRRKLAAAARHSRPVEWVWSDRHLVIYRSDRREAEAIAPPSRQINLNSFDDLGKFEQTTSWLPPEIFLAEARQRIAAGQMVFTATAGGKLAYYCWLVPEQRNGHFPFVDQDYVYPPGSAVIYNAYSHPDARGEGLHQCGLKAIIKWALGHSGANYVYGAIDINNHTSRYCSENIGRRPYEVLFRKCRFGRVTRGRWPPSFVAEYDANRR